MFKSNNAQVVPWYNSDEFKKVYQQLFSPEISNKRQAVDQISIWETRCYPSLPAAIDSSLSLTNAIIQDNLRTNFSTVVRYEDIKIMYSSAIIRFVNLTVDVHGKQNFSGSLADWAKKLGIPSYIVDIRNEATHSVMPYLSKLRLAAENCMIYLKETYWDIEASNMTDYSEEPTVKDTDIDELIRCYGKLKLQVMCRSDADDSEEVNLELQEVLKNIRSQIRKKSKLFAEMLAESNLFILCEDDLKLCLSEMEFRQFQAEYDDGDESPCVPKLPAFLELFWSDLINLLHSVSVVPFFLECLLKSQARKPALEQKLIISWVNTILNIYEVGRFGHSNLKWIFKDRGILVDWYKMLLAAVQQPCKYVPFILQCICSHLNVEHNTTAQDLVQLTAIYLGEIQNFESSDSLESLNNRSFYTVEDIKETKKLGNAQQENIDDVDENIFHFCPDDRYMTWELGHRINSTIETENELSEEIDFEVSDGIVEEIFHNNNENDMDDCSGIDYQSLDSINDEIQEEFCRIDTFLYTL